MLRQRSKIRVSLKKLVYDRDGQREIAAEHFERIKYLLNQGAFQSQQGSILFPTTEEDRGKIKKATEDGALAILIVMLRMFDIKNPAFAEEQEWRLISFSTKSGEETGTKFRSCGEKIIPYFEVKLEELDIEPIGHVVLGPKHQTPRHVMERILAGSGFKAVEISNSSATYR